MVVSKLLIMILLSVPVVIGITVLIYMLFYRRRINKRLAEGNVSGKPMMSPIAFFIITLICVSVAVPVIFISIVIFTIKNVTSTPSYHGGFDGKTLIHVRDVYEEDLEDSPFEGYKTGDDIAGYTMHKQENGDLTFYYYIVNGNMQGVLPRLIVVSEASGDVSELGHGYHINAKEGVKTFDLSGSGSNSSICFIECTEFEGDITINEYYYDEDAYNYEFDKEKPSSYEEKLDAAAKYKGTLELNMAYPVPGE